MQFFNQDARFTRDKSLRALWIQTRNIQAACPTDADEQADILYDTRKDNDIQNEWRPNNVWNLVSILLKEWPGTSIIVGIQGGSRFNEMPVFREISEVTETLTFVIQSHEQRNNIIGGILLQHTTTESCHLVYT